MSAKVQSVHHVDTSSTQVHLVGAGGMLYAPILVIKPDAATKVSLAEHLQGV